MGLDREVGWGSVCCAEVSWASLVFEVFEDSAAFALLTWCMLDVPLPGLPFPELQRPQMGRNGLPWCSNSYHTHCAHKQQSTNT
jgi:hypothetical protein